MAKTKIWINGRFLGQRFTGVQRFAIESLLSLDALLERHEATRDFEFTVIAPPRTPAPALRRIGFVTGGYGGGALWEQLWLPLLTRGGLLVGFGPTGPLLKARQLVTIHDAAVFAHPETHSFQFVAWHRLLLPLLARRLPLFMTVSRFSRAEIARYLSIESSRIRVSGEGWEHILRIEPDETVLARHGLTPGRYVLAVSSLSPQKNFGIIPRAVAKLDALRCQVVVAGGADPRIFDHVGEAWSRRAKLLGYVTDQELRALYENAAVFVFPSRYEGFGIPPLEAMALGCPVIASRAASMPEVCGDAALYFSPDDADELARLLTRLLRSEDERNALIRKGHAQLRRHSWLATAESYLALLYELRAAESAAEEVLPARQPAALPPLREARTSASGS